MLVLYLGSFLLHSRALFRCYYYYRVTICIEYHSVFCLPFFSSVIFAFCFGIAKRLTFVFMTSNNDYLTYTNLRKKLLRRMLWYIATFPFSLLELFPGVSSACFDAGLSEKYNLPPEKTDPTRARPLLLRQSCQVLGEKLGDLGPLGCQIEWGFTRLVLGVHVCAMLQQ
jgi:hypothetical protein